MKTTTIATTAGVEKLAYRPKETAAMLSISERHLCELTRQGRIKAIKAGRSTLYTIEAIREFLNGNGK